MYNSVLWPEGKIPGAYSWFHFLWLAILIGLILFSILYLRKRYSSKQDLIMCRVLAITFIALEISKFIYRCYDAQKVYAAYFSFYICTIPMYLYTFASFFKKADHPIRRILLKSAVYIGLLGGLAVMIYPVSVLNKTSHIFLSFHTMIWHTLLVASSCYYLIVYDVGKNFLKELRDTMIIFLIFIVGAITVNELTYKFYIDTFNSLPKDYIDCLSISRHYKTSYPILSKIQFNVPYPVFVLIFIIVLAVAITILHFVFRLIKYHKLNLKEANK